MRNNGEFGDKIGAKIGMKIAEKIGERVFGGGSQGEGRAHGGYNARPDYTDNYTDNSAQHSTADYASNRDHFSGRQNHSSNHSSGHSSGRRGFGTRRPEASMLDDMAGMIGGLAGIVADMRGQIAGDIRSRMQYAAGHADLATRQDIDRLSAMIQSLAKRVDALEQVFSGEEAAEKTNKKQPATKPAAATKTSARRQTPRQSPRQSPPQSSVKKTAQQAAEKPAGKVVRAGRPPSATKSSYQQILDDREESRVKRTAIAKKWKKRSDLLKERGISRAKFCADHGLPSSQFTRYVNGLNLPGWDAIHRVEKALKDAGV